MFNGLEQQLNKANNIFVKARKQYEAIVKAAEAEVEVAEVIMDTAKETIKTAEQVKECATNAIAGIKQIIGEAK